MESLPQMNNNMAQEYKTVDEVQKAIERDIEAQQELQKIILKLEEEFETSSVRSQNLDVDLGGLRELKSLGSPPRAVCETMEVAIMCLYSTNKKKKFMWKDITKELANPKAAKEKFETYDFSQITEKDLARITKQI